MIGFLSAGLLITVAAYFMLVKTWGKGPTKAKKQEKSEIIRQLLARSEQESRLSANPTTTPKLHASRHGFASTPRKS